MISKPLFIMVAQSMVIFAPMSQFGCFKACSGETCSSSFMLFPKNGPPEAVKINFFRAFLSGQP